MNRLFYSSLYGLVWGAFGLCLLFLLSKVFKDPIVASTVTLSIVIGANAGAALER